MSPEELNRTIEFIVQSQARLAAAQEQDRQDRIEFEKWAKGLHERQLQSIAKAIQLLDGQSQRLDRADKMHDELLKELREFRADTSEFQKQALYLLNQILQNGCRYGR
jgi:hypothetical protein